MLTRSTAPLSPAPSLCQAVCGSGIHTAPSLLLDYEDLQEVAAAADVAVAEEVGGPGGGASCIAARNGGVPPIQEHPNLCECAPCAPPLRLSPLPTMRCQQEPMAVVCALLNGPYATHHHHRCPYPPPPPASARTGLG